MKKRAFLFLIAVGCSGDTLPKYVDLGGLRILALHSDYVAPTQAAEYSPGDVVRVTPWVSDFRGGTRTIEYQWQACADPGIAYGVQPSCTNVSGATTAVTAALTIPATERTGSANTFDVTIPATILDGRSTVEQTNGVNYLVTYKLVASDGVTISSFRRLLVTALAKPTKNQNPNFTDILAAGTSLAAFPGGKVDLQAVYSASSREAYSTMKSDGTLYAATEDMITTWFITTGEVELYRTINQGPTSFNPKDGKPTDHTPFVLAVMRDGRGGVSVVLRSVP